MIFFGVTGRGKTTGARHFLQYVLAQHLVDLVLIHDVKKPVAQYDGPIIHDARQVLAGEGVPESFPAVRVLRRKNLDHMPSIEHAARVTLQAGYDEVRTMLIIDELQRGLTDGGKKFAAPSLRRIYSEGLGMRASVVATKQLPQDVPTEATGQSTIVYFGSTTEGVNFLVDAKKITPDQGQRMLALPVGQFMVKLFEGEFLPGVFQVPPP